MTEADVRAALRVIQRAVEFYVKEAVYPNPDAPNALATLAAHVDAGARSGRRHVEDARYYVDAESCETCAMPERDGPCYRCAVRAVQAALDAALLPPAAPEETR